MTQKERDHLLFDLELLKILLDFRVKNSKMLFKNQKEAEEYIDAILDQINDIKAKLKGHE